MFRVISDLKHMASKNFIIRISVELNLFGILVTNKNKINKLENVLYKFILI